MGRDLQAKRLSYIIGKKNVCRLQSFLKFFLSFRNDYYYDSANRTKPERGKVAIFFIDGKTIHGGLSDRLRGLFSVYDYCLSKGIDFKVYWVFPFKLQDYLEPNNVNWLIDKKDISYNLKDVSFRFFNSYSQVMNDEENYFKLMNTRKPILHVYSNITLHEEKYHRYFAELFEPSAQLSEAIQYHTTEIGGKYVSITFRFIGLLGDFQDTNSHFGVLEDGEKELYVNKCLDAINRIHSQNPGVHKILVTSDSSIFLSKASELPFVYIIRGVIAHMDNAKSEVNDNANLKTFTDLLMISKAERCYVYSYGRMFKASKFARTAALIGGREFIEIRE